MRRWLPTIREVIIIIVLMVFAYLWNHKMHMLWVRERELARLELLLHQKTNYVIEYDANNVAVRLVKKQVGRVERGAGDSAPTP